MSNDNGSKGEENLRTNKQIEESLSFISKSPVYKQKQLEEKMRREEAEKSSQPKKAVVKKKTVSGGSQPRVVKIPQARVAKKSEPDDNIDVVSLYGTDEKKAEIEKMREEKPLPEFNYKSKSSRSDVSDSKKPSVSKHEKVSHEKIQLPISEVKRSKHERVTDSTPDVQNETIMNVYDSKQDEVDNKVRQIKNSISENSRNASYRNEESKPEDPYARFRRTSGAPTTVKPRKQPEINEEDLFEGEEPIHTSDNTDGEVVAGGLDKSKIITIVLVAILVIALGIFYTVGYMGFKGRYLKNTYVNGVNIGGIKIGEANELIASAASSSGVTITKDDGEKVTFSGDQYGCKYSVPANATFGEEKHKFWFTKLFHSTEYNIDLEGSYSENALRALIQNYEWGTTDPVNARLEEKDDGTYEIIPEENGDKLDGAKFAEYVIQQVNDGKSEINVSDADCYLEADITSEDLQSELDLVNSTGDMTVTIDFNDSQETIDSSTISSWVSLDEDGNLQVDQDGVASYVSEIADEYNTYGTDRQFNATVDGNITVPWTATSIYGWKINEETMATKIVDAIKTLETSTIKPSFSIFGYGDYSKDDIGDTYIELDISEQHFWLYKQGECVLDDDVVTGTATDPEKATPTGIYCVWDMIPGKTLGTMEVQGYECWVDWWMPFTYVGIGFHDLNRSAYGGEIYQTNGSHGCVNLSKSTAEELYNSIEKGIPVVAHD